MARDNLSPPNFALLLVHHDLAHSPTYFPRFGHQGTAHHVRHFTTPSPLWFTRHVRVLVNVHVFGYGYCACPPLQISFPALPSLAWEGLRFTLKPSPNCGLKYRAQQTWTDFAYRQHREFSLRQQADNCWGRLWYTPRGSSLGGQC